MSRSCHSESVFALAWESVFPDKRERIATTSLRTGFAMTARKRFTAKKGINPVLRTGFIPSATGSGHVITCTARRWVVSGQLYCFQLPPAKGRREACKPFTDPTSRITNVRINRAAAHRSKFSFGIFSALPASRRLDVQKVRLRRLAIGRTKNLAERGGGGAFPPWLRQRGCSAPRRGSLLAAAPKVTKRSA